MRWITAAALALGCSGPEADPRGAPPDTEAQPLEVLDLPEGSPYRSHFNRHVDVFGVRILGAEGVPDAKLLHAATITAEYVDNDEDGSADEAAVVTALSDARAVLVMFETADALEESDVFEEAWLDEVSAQDLAADETAPAGGFDASLEEVLHLIQNHGWATVHADARNDPGGRLALAMDTARGGHFTSIPDPYPDEAWYHYDDRTCDYECMATEYFYWALTSSMGLQADRCARIDDEWELCTPGAVAETDTAVTALLTDPTLGLPSQAPDARYAP